MKKIMGLLAIMACVCGTANAKTMHLDCVSDFIPNYAPPSVTNDGFRVKIDIPLDQPGKRAQASILRQSFSTVAVTIHSDTDSKFKGPQVVNEANWLKDDSLTCGVDQSRGAVMCAHINQAGNQDGSNEGLFINLRGVWQVQPGEKKARLVDYLLDVRGNESQELHNAFPKKFPLKDVRCNLETN